MKKSDLIAIRDYQPNDVNFIYVSWLKNLRYSNEWFGMIEQDVYFKNYHSVIERILKKPSISVKIACLKEDSDVILGYAVYEGNRLDYLYVKSAWRAIGLSKMLLGSNKIEVVTHITDVAKAILKKHPEIKFNPFL